MLFHSTTIHELFSGCSVPVGVGPPETGKSTAIRLGLALFGLQESSLYVKGANAFFLARSAASVLPYAIDDPKSKGKVRTNQLDVGELIIDIFNGSALANMKTGQVKPITGPVIATNRPLDEPSRFVNEKPLNCTLCSITTVVSCIFIIQSNHKDLICSFQCTKCGTTRHHLRKGI